MHRWFGPVPAGWGRTGEGARQPTGARIPLFTIDSCLPALLASFAQDDHDRPVTTVGPMRVLCTSLPEVGPEERACYSYSRGEQTERLLREQKHNFGACLSRQRYLPTNPKKTRVQNWTDLGSNLPIPFMASRLSGFAACVRGCLSRESALQLVTTGYGPSGRGMCCLSSETRRAEPPCVVIA